MRYFTHELYDEILGGGLARLWKNKAIEENKKSCISCPHESFPHFCGVFPKVTWMCRTYYEVLLRPFTYATIKVAPISPNYLQTLCLLPR